jgi:imidazolonepropionase-like amidohydrolase
MMKRTLIALVTFLLLFTGCRTAQQQGYICDASLPMTALVNATLIDGYGSDPIPDTTVLIQGERICAISSGGSPPIPGDAAIIDLKNAYLLPGIINAHVHGTYKVERLAAWAQAGVTTVRDMGAPYPDVFEYIDNVDPTDPQYARRVVSGSILTSKGGYPIAIFGFTARQVVSPEDAIRAVDETLQQGADFIKIALESGEIFYRNVPILTTQETEMIVAEAHRLGALVSAHVTCNADMIFAMKTGVDDIAHMPVDKVYDFKNVVASGIYIEPTLELWQNVNKQSLNQAQENLRLFVKTGGKVALGTDYLGYWTAFQLGMPTIEMRLMQEAGMSPAEIITAATVNAAHVCNLENEIGSIEVGKIADILVVQDNPYDDLKSLAHPLMVIHNGTLIRDER